MYSSAQLCVPRYCRSVCASRLGVMHMDGRHAHHWGSQTPNLYYTPPRGYLRNPWRSRAAHANIGPVWHEGLDVHHIPEHPSEEYPEPDVHGRLVPDTDVSRSVELSKVKAKTLQSGSLEMELPGWDRHIRNVLIWLKADEALQPNNNDHSEACQLLRDEEYEVKAAKALAAIVMRPGNGHTAASYLKCNPSMACAVLIHSSAPLKRRLEALGALDDQGHVPADETLSRDMQALRQQLMQAEFPGVYSWRYHDHHLHLCCDEVPAEVAAEELRRFADPAQRRGEAGPLTLSHFDLAHLCQDATVGGRLGDAIRACSALRLEHYFLSGGDKVLDVLQGDKRFSRLEVRHAVWAEEGLLLGSADTSGRTTRWMKLMFHHNALDDVRFTGDTTPLGRVGDTVAKMLCDREKRRLASESQSSPPPSPMRVLHMEAASLSTELLTEIVGWSHLESLRVVPQFARGPAAVDGFVASLQNLSVRAPASQLEDLQLLPGTPTDRQGHFKGWKVAAMKLIHPLSTYLDGGHLRKLDLGALPLTNKAAYDLAGCFVFCAPPLEHLAMNFSPECLVPPAQYVNPMQWESELKYSTLHPGLCTALMHLPKLTHLSLRLAYMHPDLIGSCPGFARVPVAEAVEALKHALSSLADLSELRLACAGDNSKYGLRDSRILPACGARLGLRPSRQDKDMSSARCVLAGDPDGSDIWQAVLPSGPRVGHLQVLGTASLDSLGGLPAVSSHLTSLCSLLVGCTRESSNAERWTRDQYSAAAAPPCFECLSQLRHLRHMAVVSMQCNSAQLRAMSALQGLRMLHLSEVMLPQQGVVEEALRAALTPLTLPTELGLRNCVTDRPSSQSQRPGVSATGKCGEDKPLQYPGNLDISHLVQQDWLGCLLRLQVVDLQGTDLQEQHTQALAAHLSKMTGLEHLGLPRVQAPCQQATFPRPLPPAVHLLKKLLPVGHALKIVVATGIEAADLRTPGSRDVIAQFIQDHPNLQDLHIHDSRWPESARKGVKRDRKGEAVGEALGEHQCFQTQVPWLRRGAGSSSSGDFLGRLVQPLSAAAAPGRHITSAGTERTPGGAVSRHSQSLMRPEHRSIQAMEERQWPPYGRFDDGRWPGTSTCG